METKSVSLKNVIVFVLTITVIALAIFSMDILLMLFASFVITCAIVPLINKMEKFIPRVWAVTIVLLLMILMSIIVLLPLISIIFREAAGLVGTLPDLVDNVDKLFNIRIFNHSISEYITFESLKDTIAQSASGLVENSIIAGKLIANFLTAIFAISIMVFYFTYDEKRLTEKFIEFFPKNNKETARRIFDSISSKVGNYIFAQGIAMIFVGVVTTIGLLILHNSHAFILGFITCIFDIIPVIGPSVAVAIGLVTSASGGIGYVFLTFVIYIIAQWAQNQLLRPIIFGKFLNMHPLVIIISLLLSARFLGFWGIILAPAIASVICVLVDELYLKKINE